MAEDEPASSSGGSSRSGGFFGKIGAAASDAWKKAGPLAEDLGKRTKAGMSRARDALADGMDHHVYKHVRNVVSKGKSRFIDPTNDLDLDLTYITRRIIAMALPGEGISSTYRNNIDDVVRFFNIYHNGRFRIFNLSEIEYDYSKFGDAVLDYGWKDHHAPPLALLVRSVCAAANWLDAHPENVVAVHCKAGKGRTGTFIASLLRFMAFCDSAQAGVALFSAARRAAAAAAAGDEDEDDVRASGSGNGEVKPLINMPSQRRYVEYFHQLVEGTVTPHRRTMTLERVVINCVPRYYESLGEYGGFWPLIQIFRENTEKVAEFSSPERHLPKDDIDCILIVCDPPIVLEPGDYLFVISTRVGSIASEKVGRVNLHTGYLEDAVRLVKGDCDELCKKSNVPDEFTLDLIFVSEEWKEPAPASGGGRGAAASGDSVEEKEEKKAAEPGIWGVDVEGLRKRASEYQASPPNEDERAPPPLPANRAARSSAISRTGMENAVHGGADEEEEEQEEFNAADARHAAEHKEDDSDDRRGFAATTSSSGASYGKKTKAHQRSSSSELARVKVIP